MHENFAALLQALAPKRLFVCETAGNQLYTAPRYQAGDAFLFGPETRGLTPEFLAQVDVARLIRLPMLTTERSLNLANCVAVVVYEAWRQLAFS